MNKTYDIVEFLYTHPRLSKPERKAETERWRGKNFDFQRPTTIVVGQVPSFETIMRDMADNHPSPPRYFMTFGMSVCHDDDEFVRKIGVHVATKNSKFVEFEVTFISATKQRCYARFDTSDLHIEIEYKKDMSPKILGIHKHRGCNHG